MRKKLRSVLHSTMKAMEKRVTKDQLLKELDGMRAQLDLLNSCEMEMRLVQTRYMRLLESSVVIFSCCFARGRRRSSVMKHQP